MGQEKKKKKKLAPTVCQDEDPQTQREDRLSPGLYNKKKKMRMKLSEHKRKMDFSRCCFLLSSSAITSPKIRRKTPGRWPKREYYYSLKYRSSLINSAGGGIE